MDFDLSEAQKILLDTARNFFEKEAKDLARKIEKTGEYPLEFWRKMSELGWLGIVFPEEYGGTNGDFVDLILLLEEMGKALIPGPYISTVISGLAILHFGTEKQKKEILPKLTEGKLILIPALMNPQPKAPRSKNRERMDMKKGVWELSGIKLFVPYAHLANGFLYKSEARKEKTFFLVDAKSEGVRWELLKTIAWDGQCQVFLDRVKVPRANILGGRGKGEGIAQKIEEWGALSQCAFLLGMLEKVLEMALKHAKQREQFERPIGSFQAIQHQCADMITEIDKVKFLTYRAAWKLSEQNSAPQEISMAKARASDASRQVCLLGIKIHGGIGISEEHDLQLYFRRAKAAEISFGDGHFHREIVAEHMGL